jgi:hypothetical protein
MRIPGSMEGTVKRKLITVIVLAALSSAAANGAEKVVPSRWIDQGWSKEVRELFYFTPQGSRMMPFAWFMALETSDGQRMFSDAAHLQRYGFIPADGPHPLNPGNLPIGFALDPVAPAYVGLTCAACHTTNVTVEGRTIRVDGGPSHIDFDTFYADLARAVTSTLFDPEKFQRFATRVLGTPSVTGLSELQQEFAAFQARIAGEAAIRHPRHSSGFGRVDALTQIVNSLSVRDQGEPQNLRPVGAPVSYPPLWLTPDLEFVQWNPIAASPIGRNSGEVLGVFGTTTLTGDPKDWFASSLLLNELHALESWVADLKPPRWDEKVFGKINANAAAHGQDLFRQHCAACHNAPPYRRTDPSTNHFGKTFIAIGRVDYKKVGTDPTYVDSLVRRLVRTNVATAHLLDGKPVVPAGAYFLRTVEATVARAMNEARLTDAEKLAMNGFRLRPPKTAGGQPEPYTPPSLTDLKAGPLAGAWLTGPYLHNGSVPTVYELLSPLEKRRKVFWTGGRELDRKRLGLISDEAPGRFRFDTSVPGNRNTGHLYPPQGLSHRERMAIIEYLKTL